MTIKERLSYQNASGNICLIRQGLFYRGYNRSAWILHSLLGYQIQSKVFKSCGGVLYYVGFPSVAIEKVLAKFIEQGGCVVEKDKGLIEISGIATAEHDTAEMDAIVAATAHGKRDRNNETHMDLNYTVQANILNFDILNATPLEALNFVIRLKERLRESIK